MIRQCYKPSGHARWWINRRTFWREHNFAVSSCSDCAWTIAIDIVYRRPHQLARSANRRLATCSLCHHCVSLLFSILFLILFAISTRISLAFLVEILRLTFTVTPLRLHTALTSYRADYCFFWFRWFKALSLFVNWSSPRISKSEKKIRKKSESQLPI